LDFVEQQLGFRFGPGRNWAIRVNAGIPDKYRVFPTCTAPL